MLWIFTTMGGPNTRGVIRLRPNLCNGVKANVQLKSSIPIGAKVEIGFPRAFTLGVKAEIEEKKINLPQVTNKCWTL